MLEITSTGCGKFHHAELRLSFDDHLALERDARDLVARLERHVAAGTSFHHGSCFTYGWVGLRFHQIEQNVLAVQEPDFHSLPIKYTDSVTETLRHFRWQNACAAMLGLQQPSTLPAMTQTAALCPRLQNAETFFMERHGLSSSNSGWIIGCTEPVHDHVHSSEMLRGPLYEILTRLDTSIAAFLALPVGTKVLKRPHGLWISCNGRSHQIRRNSLLGHLMQSIPNQTTALVSIDESHNLLRWPPGQQTPCYLIPPAARLSVRCPHQSPVVAPAEISALGIQQPNTAVLLTRNLQWRESWNTHSGADFNIARPPSPIPTAPSGAEIPRVAACPGAISLAPGEELILIVGYSDSATTRGAVAAMWSARLKVTAY